MKKSALIFCHSYNPPFVDVCNQYAQVFDKNIYEISVVYLTGKFDQNVQQKTLGDHVYFLNIPKRKVRGLKLAAIKRMVQLGRKHKFDIVVCHRFKAIYIIALADLWLKIPRIFSVMHELNTMQRWSRRLFAYFAVRMNIIFAGVSNAVRENILNCVKGLSEKQVVMLPNTIDSMTFELQLFDRKAAREQLNLKPEDFVFGNVGRLAKNKDQKTLIKAFANIADKYPNAKLIIIGKGNLEQDLKRLAKQLNIIEQVIFAGFMPEAFRYMRAFDVYVSSSSQEAFGRVLLEAMVAKLPVIATAVHGVPEVLGDTGVLTPIGDLQALGAAMQLFINLPGLELQRYGESGYQHVAQNFSHEGFKKNFLKIISQNQ